MVKLLLVFSLVYANAPVVVPHTSLPTTKVDTTQINKYLDKADVIKYMESTGDYSYEATYYYNLAYAYMLVHDYAQSIIYAQKASDSQPHGYYSAIDLIISNMLALKKTNGALSYLNAFIKKYPPAGPEKDIELGAAQAIPVGLIINEAVTNSYKYAFPKQKSGTITIGLKNQGDRISLIIADNGAGFTPSANKETHSLGLNLIQGLTADLRGTVNLDTNSGTSIQIDFKIDQFAIVENREQMIA